MLNTIEVTLSQLRQSKPIILCLTNVVTMDFIANCLLALGASPIMSSDEAEIEELIKISQAVYLNIGTLDSAFFKLCAKAVALANRYAKPIILDPVAAGASLIRTTTARNLSQHATIIRGNASEIMAVANNSEAHSSGVESVKLVSQAKPSAALLSKQLNATIVVSGKEDFIVSGSRQANFVFGSPLMPLITGMGCSLTAVIAAFQAVMNDSFQAASFATAFFSLAGSLAEKQANKPGSFRMAFIDALYGADFVAMQEVIDAA